MIESLLRDVANGLSPRIVVEEEPESEIKAVAEWVTHRVAEGVVPRGCTSIFPERTESGHQGARFSPYRRRPNE